MNGTVTSNSGCPKQGSFSHQVQHLLLTSLCLLLPLSPWFSLSPKLETSGLPNSRLTRGSHMHLSSSFSHLTIMWPNMVQRVKEHAAWESNRPGLLSPSTTGLLGSPKHKLLVQKMVNPVCFIGGSKNWSHLATYSQHPPQVPAQTGVHWVGRSGPPFPAWGNQTSLPSLGQPDLPSQPGATGESL